MRTLEVDLGERSYPIFIGPNLLSGADLWTPYIQSRQVLVVSNEVVAPLYLAQVRSALSAFDYAEVILPDGEEYKTLEIVSRIYDELLTRKFDRRCTLVALGGGVIGDMTGFAAATYQRGVNFIQIPTTLLSQVDSSVGGKTGVNHPLGKNMIGAFHQPQCVLADTSTLKSLPDRELSAGLAEIIKYGLIDDAEFFAWLEQHMDELVARDDSRLEEAIERSCQDKARVVAQDELEAGRRALLNLGHTFGHAIEAGMGYGKWLHGEAVGTGMLMAAKLSRLMLDLTAADEKRIVDLIKRANLPPEAPGLGVERYRELMSVDKKVRDGKIRLVLMKGIGGAYLCDDYDPHLLRATLEN